MLKTKILCTIGPSSWDETVLKKMIENGMTIARINGAFADNAELERVAKLIRSISKDVALMLDIKGTEVRLNKFQGSIQIKPGGELVIGNSEKDPLYPVTYLELYRDLKAGNILHLDDGKVTIEVIQIKDKKIICKVISGEEILPGKTINTPGIPLTNAPITKRDIEQIKFAVKDNWDYVAASFVRHANDIEQVKKFLTGTNIKVMAKIEDEQGVTNLDEILEVCDGIIIARGDLGVEMPYELIPMIQKEMITKCLLKAKPAIVATHMLESMIEKPIATRAEVSDVANAVFDGCDVVWLSAETSKGKYPIEAVKTLSRISKSAEGHVVPEILYGNPDINPITVALARGVIDICQSLDIDKIIVATGTGKTARVISSFKPRQPIIALTSNDTFKRQLQSTWGVTAFTFGVDKETDRDEGIKKIAKKIIDEKVVKPDDLILVIRGTTPITKRTNSLEVGVAKDLLEGN